MREAPRDRTNGYCWPFFFLELAMADARAASAPAEATVPAMSLQSFEKRLFFGGFPELMMVATPSLRAASSAILFSSLLGVFMLILSPPSLCERLELTSFIISKLRLCTAF